MEQTATVRELEPRPRAGRVNVTAFAWTWPQVLRCLACGCEYLAHETRTPCPRCRFVEKD